MTWRAEDYAALQYTVDGDVLDEESTTVRLIVQVNGKTEVDLSSRTSRFEPGLICFLSRPDDRGIQVVKVVPAQGGMIAGDQEQELAVPAWARELLGMGMGIQ